jgi:putative flippase GtrA
MSSHSQRPGLLGRLTHGRIVRILRRYTAGSALAAIASEVTLLSLLGFHLTGPKLASVAGWLAGAIVNYFLSRNWAWGLKGRANAWREVLPFWATSVACLVASTWTSDLAHGYAPSVTSSHPLQLAFVGTVYLGTYGVLFVGKFLLFHFVIFTDRKPAGATTSR